MFKQIKNELKEYHQHRKEKYFTSKRVRNIFKQTIKRTKALWIFTLIALIIFSRPINFSPSSNLIYVWVVLSYIVLSLFFINFLIALYKNYKDDYKTYFTKSVTHYQNLLKIIITACTVFVLIGLGNAQVYFINNYLNPRLENCSYYDWYGNEIYQTFNPGECPNLLNMEAKKEQSIKFGVFKKVAGHNRYTEQEIIYQNENITEFYVRHYELTKEQAKHLHTLDFSTLPVYSINEMINWYKDDEFTSTRNIYSEDKKIFSITIHSTRVDDSDILVTKEYKGETTELFHLTNQTNESLYLPNYYSALKQYDLNWVNEDFYTIFPDGSKVTLKSNEYQRWSINGHNLYVLANIRMPGSYYYFFHNSYNINDEVTEMDQIDNNELAYRHIFTYTNYGFYVKHYNYSRNKWGKYEKLETYPSGKYCYASTNFYNVNDYQYETITSQPKVTYCGSPLIYHDNPLFLTYKIE